MLKCVTDFKTVTSSAVLLKTAISLGARCLSTSAVDLRHRSFQQFIIGNKLERRAYTERRSRDPDLFPDVSVSTQIKPTSHRHGRNLRALPKMFRKIITPPDLTVPQTENVWTVPNLLCVIRMGMAPILGYVVIKEQYGAAVGLFLVAGATDLLDGWIARVVPGQSSVMGSFLDPLADKILVGVLFISLTYMDLIPVALTGLILSRDVLLIAAAFYIRYQSLDPPRTLARYFNLTHPTAQLAPTFISKVNTGIQLGLVAATLVSTVIPYDVHSYLVALWYCTATTTIASGLSYIFVKDTYKFLKRKHKFRGLSKDERNADRNGPGAPRT